MSELLSEGQLTPLTALQQARIIQALNVKNEQKHKQALKENPYSACICLSLVCADYTLHRASLPNFIF